MPFRYYQEICTFAFQNQKGMWRDIFVVMVQLLAAPHTAWRELKSEQKSPQEFLSKYLHPIFGIIALASFIGGLWFVRDGNLQSALKDAIVSVVAVYGGYFIASYVLNDIAPRFGVEKDIARLRQFVGYASVVMYLLYVVTAFMSGFFILWLLAIYTIHIVNTGAVFFLHVPEDKRINFSLAASALIVLTPIAIQVLFSTLMN